MPADAGLPPWSTRLLSEIDAADQRATTIAGGLSREQLNWKPSPGEWSVGQCIDHLRVTNEVYVAAMASSLVNRPAGRAEEITPGWFGRWFIRTVIEPSQKSRKGRAPRKVVPRSEVGADVLDRFIGTNWMAREFVRRAATYDVNRVRFKNPFVRGIRFTVGTGLQILLGHQRRHLLQAERVRERVEFPREPPA
jgi:DinB family protein